MQLKKKKNIALAASTLLGAVHTPVLKAEEAKWEYDALSSAYTESDDRIQVVSFKMKGAREKENGSAVSFLIGIDAISGSSPSGAVGFAGLSKSPLDAAMSKAPLSVDTLAKSSGGSAPPPPARPRRVLIQLKSPSSRPSTTKATANTSNQTLLIIPL